MRVGSRQSCRAAAAWGWGRAATRPRGDSCIGSTATARARTARPVILGALPPLAAARVGTL
eukprot:3307499-Prymnesium_polylepis.1